MEVDAMSSVFWNIAITPEIPVKDEAAKITSLLTYAGFHRVHLRHPGATPEEIAAILSGVPSSLHHRISLHSCHVVPDMRRLGLHLSSKNTLSDAHSVGGLISKSCHSIEEVEASGAKYDYMFLSPVFDSLSKEGYASNFNLDAALRQAIGPHQVIALGGVTPQNIYKIKRAGFAGAAMLGTIPWTKDMDEFHRYALTAHMVQFITDGTPEQCVQQTREAIKGGIRWVQLRMKDAAAETVKSTALEILPLCRRSGAIFIVNDHPQLALEIGADGVHLGKNDMPPAEARRLLGPEAIIGATANSLDDIKRVSREPIDYIGLGPLHFTGTKKNLADVLGIGGVSSVLDYMRCNDIDIPVVVIGGITVDDIPAVIKAGADGVAVSGAIAHASDIAEAARKFTDII